MCLERERESERESEEGEEVVEAFRSATHAVTAEAVFEGAAG